MTPKRVVAKRNLQKRLGVVILAAGKATRMESDKNKVLHPVAGKPMLGHVLESARLLNPDRIVVVVGHQGDEVQKAFAAWPRTKFVRQRQMRGTGDAVRQAAPAFRSFEGAILVLYGDIPGIRSETLRRLTMVHSSSQNAVTLLTADFDDPTGYGRIVLEADGSVARIVEEPDASDGEKEICEVNTGIGLYDPRFLFSSLKLLRPTNEQKELYLTDLVGMARKAGRSVGRLRLKDALETIGVNDREGLAEVSRIFYDQKALRLLQEGVTLEDPASTCIEPGVEVGKDSVIGGQVLIRGKTKLGQRVTVEACADILDSDVAEDSEVGRGTVLRRVKVGKGARIGASVVIGS